MEQMINGLTYDEWFKELCHLSVSQYGYAPGAIEDQPCWFEMWQDEQSPSEALAEDIYAGR